MFLGKYQHSLDSKGRLTIPSRFRELLIADGAYLTQGFDHNLMVLPAPAFQRIYERVNKMSMTDANARLLKRHIFSAAEQAVVDKAGRILIPEHLRQACEASLRRMRLERIDLYQLHAPDPDVPLADSIGELARLQREGKIRHIGVSNVGLDELRLARGIAKVVSVQNRYNVGDRRSDDVLRVCAADGIAFLPWAPLAGREREAGRSGSIEALGRLAKSRGITETQAALAWLLARSPVVLPIPGTSSVAHLEENVAAAALRLTPEELARIG